MSPVWCLSLLVACLTALFSCGCRHGNAINFVTNTQFGVKVGVNAEKIPEVNIGYSRQEAARVPVYLEQNDSEDGFSASPPTVNSILKRAKSRLEQNDAAGDALAIRLVASAMDLAKDSDGVNHSQLLKLIDVKIKSLSPTPANASQVRSEVMDLIDSEIDKPAEFAQFYESAKFIGKRSNLWAEDGYSVFGTFAGTGAGSVNNSTNGSVKIAQFFATGVAAQILAEQGGAAAVNPLAEIPGERLTPEKVAEIKKREAAKVKQEIDQSKKIAKWVFSNDPDGMGGVTVAERLANLKSLRDNNSQDPNDALLQHYSTYTTEVQLAEAIQDLELEIQEMFHKNLP